MLFRPFQDGGRPGDHVVDGVAELLHDDAAGRRGAEAVERERGAVVADPALPALRDAGLHTQTGAHLRREHLAAAALCRPLEPLPERLRNDDDAAAMLGSAPAPRV